MQQNSAYICMHFCSVSYVLARIGDRMKWAAGKKCLPNGKNFLPEGKNCAMGEKSAAGRVNVWVLANGKSE